MGANSHNVNLNNGFGAVPTISVPHVDFSGWLQAIHGPGGNGLGHIGAGLHGLAGNSLLNPTPLARQGGIYDGPARSGGAAFAA